MKPCTVAYAFAIFAVLASSAMAQEREWSLDAADEDAFLVFGVPQTDDVGLSFWCKIGSGKISMFYPVTWTDLEEGKEREIQVNVGGQTFNLSGKSAARTEAGAASLEIEIPAQSELIASAVKNDRLTLSVDKHRGVYPLTGANFEGLLRLCRGE
jgi:hypothetical protein